MSEATATSSDIQHQSTDLGDAPVCKTITVDADAERAFRVFTEGIDTWWPRTHHIGNSPLSSAILQGQVGGRVFSKQEDGTECDWARVLVWDPPHRLVLAWQITPEWRYEPEPSKASEVEVRFTPQPDGQTRVDLEHRFFARHGAGGNKMRTQVDQPGGWTQILQSFAVRSSMARALTPQEVSRAREYLEQTRDELLQATQGLNEAQSQYKATPDRWSISENVEHITIVESMAQAIVKGMRDAPQADPDHAEATIDEVITAQVPQRAQRFQAPSRILPQGHQKLPEAVERFVTGRAETLRLLAEAPALRGHVVPHPVLGPWDGYQWILAAAAHTLRHADQIAEIKRSPAFPV